MFCQTFLNIKAHTVQYFFIKMMTEAKLLKNLLPKPEEKESAQLRDDMQKLEAEIRRNESLFNIVTDENLIEALIFEQSANEARMNYLLQQARSI